MAKKKTPKRKRKSAAPKPPSPPPRDLGPVLLLLVTMQSAAKVRAVCVEKLEIPDAEVDGVLADARRRLTVAADFHRDEEVGRALVRLGDLYERSLRVQDVKTALAAQKELNKLLDLYAGAPPAGGEDYHAGGQAAADLAAVRQHLAPLGLGGDDDSTVELARLAVEKLIHLPDDA